jgi:hypothetical protein
MLAVEIIEAPIHTEILLQDYLQKILADDHKLLPAMQNNTNQNNIYVKLLQTFYFYLFYK